ncbi:D-hexose-6-phosphate mutarotase [Marinobacter zhanjiangensis]|uniref:Putative glucose-6-phosphate 1-epimerase n=1 Tax=Marinobacter zhanjiangensis TaxID=578215 RepID=A0ABQ3B807_9GAMM|nr:D-hexose-6-phosphate mutarotase [Marinobacter zhanjiangensis]GGY82618.1 D-hexose-6-phosphate mutarotase [Marinobacter zhanjiangensis]
MHELDNARHTRLEMAGELEAIRIRHPLFEATVTLQGAHLVQFAPAGERNWLWMSPQARFEKGVAIRGGVPVCWPWFGAPDRNPDPVKSLVSTDKAHGFARTAVWSLDSVEELEETVSLTLGLDATGTGAGYPWNGQARASLTLNFSPEGLTLALTTRNTSGEPLALTQALHTYLPTEQLSGTVIRGLSGARYLDTLDDWKPKQQEGAVAFEGETDRIYLAASDMDIQSPGDDVHLTSGGSQSTVVWNPGPLKAARLTDFPDDAWTGMLCVETANAADDYRTLQPGASHTLSVTLARN